MVRALTRWWLRWRIECEERELLRASIEGHAGSAYTAGALHYIDTLRDRLRALDAPRGQAWQATGERA